MTPVIAYLGPPHTHSHAATLRLLRLLGADAEALCLKPFSGFAALLAACESGEVQAAVLPYENALEGTVGEVLDALADKARRLFVHAECSLPIQHALIVKHAKVSPDAIRTLASIPIALGQCRQRLQAFFPQEPQLCPTLSTAEAVEQLAALGDAEAASHAVIASNAAAEAHGLHCLNANMSDVQENETRFLLVSNTPLWPSCLPTPAAGLPLKSSICVKLQDYPGVLMEYLGVFHRYWVNLTKMESRPTRGRMGQYRFLLDAEGDITLVAKGRLLAELKARSRYFHLQGPYVVLDPPPALVAEPLAHEDY